MIHFEIKNNVLLKITDDGVSYDSPVNSCIKIPDGVTEIADNILDISILHEGYMGYDFLSFRGIVIPSSVTKINPKAFASIKIEKEIEINPNKKEKHIVDSENHIILIFEDKNKKDFIKELKNPIELGNELFPLLFKLSEKNPTIDIYIFKKLSTLKLKNQTKNHIDFDNNVVSIHVAHSNYEISQIIIDNPFFGRRGFESERGKKDIYIFNPKTDTFDESRFRELLD